jgi:hypothetical protein
MKLFGDAPVGFLDLAGAGAAAYTQDNVVVFGHGSSSVAVGVALERSMVTTHVKG